MNAHLITTALTLILGAASAAAADRPYLSADEKDVGKLLADRNRFIMDMYEPAPADAARIIDALRELEGAQGEYQRQSALTLSRLRLAISIVYHDPGHDPSTLDAKLVKFTRQYHNILAKAPLSLRNVVRVAEASLPPDATSAARARMTQILSSQINESGTSFDIERIDGIVHGPVPPGPRPEIQLPSRPTPQSLALSSDPLPASPATDAQPAHPDTPHTHEPAAPTPAPATPAPVAPPVVSPPIQSAKAKLPPPPPPAAPAPPVRAGVPLPDAPPIEEWSSYLKQASEKYGFNPSQVEAAQSVVNSSIAIGQKHREANKEAFAAVEGTSNPQIRADKLMPLKEHMDKIYNTMVKRIDSIASLEQRNRAAAKDKPADEKK